MKNILRQAAESNKKTGSGAAAGTLDDGDAAERELAEQGAQSGENVRVLCAKKKYDEALAEVAKIRKPIDEFFDRVMVMVEDEQVRNRRLALLGMLLGQFSIIADFSEIVTERKSLQ
jgi:glycyl-tRNA synthetase beta chain